MNAVAFDHKINKISYGSTGSLTFSDQPFLEFDSIRIKATVKYELALYRFPSMYG
jgi:hypothetical protein